MPPIIVGNKQPLYRQVARIVRQRIRMRQYGPRQPLPSLRTMAREFEVSLCVVQQAVRLLEADGILASHHGKAVVVESVDASSRAAIVFGMIQPFKTGMRLRVLHYAEQAFSERGNFVITRTSDGDGAVEKSVAEHLVTNGVSGLLVWPVEQSPNGKFFQELSKTVPIVLVDRRIPDVQLPLVTHDTQAAGRDICRAALKAHRCQKLVALIDKGSFSTYDDLILGLKEQAKEMGRSSSLKILRWPLVRLVEQFARADFSAVDEYVAKLAALLESGVDGIFCPQSDIVDTVLVQSGLLDRFKLRAVGTTEDPQFNQHTRRYCESDIIQWYVDHAQAIHRGADMLGQWITTRKRPADTKPVAIGRLK